MTAAVLEGFIARTHYIQDVRAVSVLLGENAGKTQKQQQKNSLTEFSSTLKKKLVIFFKGTFGTQNC
uniref:Uncharacterized protein n=1 Tax=Nomascus leucogenys TaxID=61853 RepID=A0A2I3H1E2_NOMLE